MSISTTRKPGKIDVLIHKPNIYKEVSENAIDNVFMFRKPLLNAGEKFITTK